MKDVIVGIADYKIVNEPNKIMTIGLGSCCGVVLYDELNKIAGLLHILLPYSKYGNSTINKLKYADTGIALLYEELIKRGASPKFIKAKLVGGAHMFNLENEGNCLFAVGEKNVKACRETLERLNISIVSEDVLGSYGRTIVFDTVTNKLYIKSTDKNEKII